MTIQLKVPSIACEVCAETITKEIKNHQPEAKVEVDIETKMVTVETEASQESIKQMIEIAGHTVE
ncbi:MAG: heavy-metal-associated domain-containing protein [Xenococcaceae cyanobacterium]